MALITSFRVIRVSVPPPAYQHVAGLIAEQRRLQVQKAQDLFYIRNWSMWLDIYILLQTVIVVLNSRGAKWSLSRTSIA